MESTLINLTRTKGTIIPYEYNYYLSICIYSKLKLYQANVRKLHDKNQPGLHTISNIISFETRRGINGLDIPKGFIIVRSINQEINDFLRLGLALEPTIQICDVTYAVKGVRKIADKISTKTEVKFKSISPVLVRDFVNKKLFVDNEDRLEKNLNELTKWTLEHNYGFSPATLKNLKITVDKSKQKSVRISNTKAKESITTAFQISGRIIANPEVLKILYYKGLGSKTSLGLGCWEVE